MGFTWRYSNTLKKLGLYFGNVGGIFEPNTRDFVYKFQEDFGLKVDGVDLVVGAFSAISNVYRNARDIDSNFPIFPFLCAWKANILGVDFEKYQPIKCSDHLHLRVFQKVKCS